MNCGDCINRSKVGNELWCEVFDQPRRYPILQARGCPHYKGGSMTSERVTKSEQLADFEGYDSVEEMVEDFHADSLVPAICMNPGCDFNTHYEPDSTEGFCELCETNTCRSILVLEGII